MSPTQSHKFQARLKETIQTTASDTQKVL
jgi:hypothetical protein